MDEIFIIEKMLAPGIWEVLNDIFFTDERIAINECLSVTKKMQEIDKDFCARVTKLKKKS